MRVRTASRGQNTGNFSVDLHSVGPKKVRVSSLVAKFQQPVNYTYSSMVLVVNKKSWDKLTPAQQKIVTEESMAAAKAARKQLRDNEATQLKDLETTKGIVVARPDLGPWKAAMGPAWDKVKARVGADNFKRFMDIVEKSGK